MLLFNNQSVAQLKKNGLVPTLFIIILAWLSVNPGRRVKIKSMLSFSENTETGHNCILSESYKVGEIIYKGRNVSLWYADNIFDLRLGDMNGGILHAGDIGYFDDDNYF